MSSFVSLFVDRLSPASPQNPILIIKAPILDFGFMVLTGAPTGSGSQIAEVLVAEWIHYTFRDIITHYKRLLSC